MRGFASLLDHPRINSFQYLHYYWIINGEWLCEPPCQCVPCRTRVELPGLQVTPGPALLAR